MLAISIAQFGLIGPDIPVARRSNFMWPLRVANVQPLRSCQVSGHPSLPDARGMGRPVAHAPYKARRYMAGAFNQPWRAIYRRFRHGHHMIRHLVLTGKEGRSATILGHEQPSSPTVAKFIKLRLEIVAISTVENDRGVEAYIACRCGTVIFDLGLSDKAPRWAKALGLIMDTRADKPHSNRKPRASTNASNLISFEHGVGRTARILNRFSCKLNLPKQKAGAEHSSENTESRHYQHPERPN